ncbi:hypothetical protein Patl1_12156 [Pistacia atlantica]|uniref:Uncharacterized protein n=1 Tax=Pistacia atlantica TaxID=434234 RepID=A0ACC1A9S4_9ROSI|nr:hypothetical protein Patl1_12156 [Pistacia atlantica]
MFTAVKEGNIDFLTIFVRECPNLILKVDQDNYSIFHIAVLNHQKEIFKLIDHEVSQIVDPKLAKAKNTNGKTPRDIFYKKITAIKDEGKKWMKDTANPCMIVATLITIVGLSAPFTVPGVTREETEITNFIQKLSFRIFVISDAILLASSAGSILTFLSILTSRYADEDLLYVLPRKLLFGFSSLFLSIIALMVASCAAYVLCLQRWRDFDSCSC